MVLSQMLDSSLLLPIHDWSAISCNGQNSLDVNSPLTEHLHIGFIDVSSYVAMKWGQTQYVFTVMPLYPAEISDT